MKRTDINKKANITKLSKLIYDYYGSTTDTSRQIIAESEVENLFEVGLYSKEQRNTIESKLKIVYDILDKHSCSGTEYDYINTNKQFIRLCEKKISRGYSLTEDIIEYLNFLYESR